MSSQSIKGWETERSTSVLLSEALIIFVQEKLYIQGVTPGSIKGYENMVKSVHKALGDIDITKLTLLDIYTWKSYHINKGISERTMKGYIIRLRLLLRHFSRQFSLSIHPDDITLPKSPRTLPQAISDVEAKLIFDKCNNIRDRLVIYLLFTTGLRIEELCNIRVRNIQENKLFIVGKGKKERYVFMDETAIALMDIYLKCKLESEWLFPTCEKQMGNLPISTFAMRIAIKRCAKRAGIKRNITPHMFRHGYATHLLKNGCDIRYIQELMGHSFITSTQIYTHVTNADLHEVYKKYHVTLN